MDRNSKLKGLAAVAISILLTLSILYFNPAAMLKGSIGGLGYFGIFLIMLISNATIILPAPGLLAVFAAGSSYNIVLVGIAAGLGGALGESTGYLLGYGGEEMLGLKGKMYGRVKKWMQSHGFITLVVLSAIPNPAFDVAGIAAGSLKYPWLRFFAACAIGISIKAVLFAYLGYSLMG